MERAFEGWHALTLRNRRIRGALAVAGGAHLVRVQQRRASRAALLWSRFEFRHLNAIYQAWYHVTASAQLLLWWFQNWAERHFA